MNSEIIISRGIKIDKDYINVINYSQADMVSLCRANQVASLATFSFIRDTGTIKADFNYSSALTCNYMAFQNPDYSNKWFFAWIDDIEYRGENCIEIRYTIDQWSTWWTAINFVPVMVEREHVNDDTWKLHTLPEPVTANEYISQNVYRDYYSAYSILVFFTPQSITAADYLGMNINNIYCSPCRVFRYDCSQTGIGNMITDMINGSVLSVSNIINLSVVPNKYISSANLQLKEIQSNITVVSDNYQTASVTDLDGYIPVNNKCFLYPYNYIELENGHNIKHYMYEKFSNEYKQGTFSFRGCILPNGGVSVYPTGYDGKPSINVLESLAITDFPMIAFPIDTYSAWLAQKASTSVMQGLLTTISGAVMGAMHGGVAGAVVGAGAGLVGGVVNYLSQEENAKTETNPVTGTNNTTMDMVNYSMGFCLSQKCVRADQAEKIDNFFSQFGYNVSKVKIPNITGRTYWNYVKINGICGYGNLPESARNEINKIMNQGVTIWHSHANVGNYLVGGTKMQNPIL